jgi:hypothetical protein
MAEEFTYLSSPGRIAGRASSVLAKDSKGMGKSAWNMKYLLTSDNDRTEVDILRYLQNFHTTKLTQLF